MVVKVLTLSHKIIYIIILFNPGEGLVQCHHPIGTHDCRKMRLREYDDILIAK